MTESLELPERLIGELEELREHFRRENLVLPVVGSGLSASQLVSWPRLLEDLTSNVADPVRRSDLIGRLDRQSYLDVATLLWEKDRNSVLSALKRHFRRPRGKARPAVYDRVAALPVTHFVTTNYDPWLKEAVTRRYPGARVYLPVDPGALDDIDPGSPPLVLMLHGDADRIDALCVFTEADHTRMKENPRVAAALSALVSQRRLLLIGHSCGDPDLRAFLQGWAVLFSEVPRHYILLANASESDRSLIRQYGLQVIDYGVPGPDSHQLLPEILRVLAQGPSIQVHRAPSPAPEAKLDLLPNIRQFLRDQNCELKGVDEFIELRRSPDHRGWSRADVSWTIRGEYNPPEELRELMTRYPIADVNDTFSLCSYSDSGALGDGGTQVEFGVKLGHYGHVFAVTRGYLAGDPEMVLLRERLAANCARIEGSGLYQNVNCETLVVTSDDQIAVCLRSRDVDFAQGTWSASIEEQMLRRHRDPKKNINDHSLFDCAERGVREELGAHPDSERTRLLAFGLEWANFTAAFLMIVFVHESYDALVRAWRDDAPDPAEAVGMDCLPATVGAIRIALASRSWKASTNFRSREPANAEFEASWHLTSRARLQACMRHLEYLEGGSSA